LQKYRIGRAALRSIAELIRDHRVLKEAEEEEEEGNKQKWYVD